MVIEFKNTVVANVAVVTPRWLKNVASWAELEFKYEWRVHFRYLGIDNPGFVVIYITFNVFLRKPSTFGNSPRATRNDSRISRTSFNQ